LLKGKNNIPVTNGYNKSVQVEGGMSAMSITYINKATESASEALPDFLGNNDRKISTTTILTMNLAIELHQK